MRHENTKRPRRGILARLGKCRRGSVVIEFALGFPIFLAMTYGIFEVGRVFWVQTTMQFAIEEAARVAMVDSDATEAEIETVANNRAVGLDLADFDVDVDFEQDNTGTGNGPRTAVNITGTYDFTPYFPLVLPSIGGGNGIDFEVLSIDIVTSVRMPMVL